MKKIKGKVIVSLLLAIILGVLVYSYLMSMTKEVTVYIASQNINRGTLIEAGMLKSVRIGEEDSKIVAAGALKTLNTEQVNVAVSDIKNGRIVDETDILSASESEMKSRGILDTEGNINEEYFIGDNKRLYTVIVDGDGAVANKISKSDFVDVIYTSENSKGKKSSKMILTNIEVDDTGSVSSKDGQASQAITLIVTPQQAVKLTYAKRNGSIDFALKSKDAKTGITGEITEKNLKE